MVPYESTNISLKGALNCLGAEPPRSSVLSSMTEGGPEKKTNKRGLLYLWKNHIFYNMKILQVYSSVLI